MLFWIVTGAVALVLTVALVAALLRGHRETGPAEAFDLQVYRDQLREVEADAASGKVPPEEAERLKTEISRRLLAADAKARGTAAETGQPQGAARVMAVIVALVLVGGGFGLYTYLGVPGYPDRPLQLRMEQAEALLQDRTAQAEAEARQPATAPLDVPEDYAALVEKLRAAVSERPDDLQGHMLLTRHEAALGNARAAYTAQQQVIRLKGEEAVAQDFTDLADLMIIAAGGYVSPEAQKVLEQALSRDPDNGVARFYGGLMMAQTGRPDLGFQMWNRLLRESAAEDPWVAPIRAQITDMAARAGVTNFSLPEAPAPLRGPSAADIDNAADLSDEDRSAMIRGMVDGLLERLATEGGSPQEWARAISALGVLGEADRAGAIWTEGKTVFAGNQEALAALRDAAVSAGLASE
ncbi:c-type cytochrome biogenesis protein CcmI [Ponticoccus sp. (in: a-proteobacteria)]|uniref:c-type cytochrome biogenesis protein CcmI n=1 Tax=Ponticoccus sp. (in: a-proteobacteria) TaxID=1925025 RepID=UPI003AB6241E